MSIRSREDSQCALDSGTRPKRTLPLLIQALEEWDKAKKARVPVPIYEVVIEDFSGASAGGMCAAIAAVIHASVARLAIERTEYTASDYRVTLRVMAGVMLLRS